MTLETRLTTVFAQVGTDVGTAQNKLATVETNADVTDAGNVGTAIEGTAALTSLANGDLLPVLDVSATNELKRITYLNLRNGLENYLDTQYQPLRAVLTNTTASFTTADETKLDHLTVTAATDLDDLRTRVAGLDSAVVLKGSWDASAGTFPSGANAGDSFIVSVAGVVDGQDFVVNDRLLAITDSASTTVYAGNWLKLDYSDNVLSVNGRTGTVTGLAETSDTGNLDRNFLSDYVTARNSA